MIDTAMPLTLAAISTGVIHTLWGPDHYLPLAAAAKAEAWSQRKIVNITILCGLGHVLSAALIGLCGIGMRFFGL